MSLTAGALTTITGTLATGQTTDLYTFTGTAGEVITLQGISDAHSYGAYTYIFNADNGQVALNYNNSSGNYTSATLPAAGTYLIAVQGSNQRQHQRRLRLHHHRQHQPNHQPDTRHDGQRDDRQRGRQPHLHLPGDRRSAPLFRRTGGDQR